VKYLLADQNLLVSGGMDSVLYLWDVRSNRPVAHLFGPMVAGETIDERGDSLLVGNYSGPSTMQFIDRRYFKESSALQWDAKGDQKRSSFHIYSCRFMSESNQSPLIAGSYKNHDMRIYEAEPSSGSHE